MKPINVKATGQLDLTDASLSYISCVVFTVFGFTGSMTPQIKQDPEGQAISPNYFNCGYTNLATGAYYSAGTPITTDGMYITDATASIVSLNVTDAGDGDFTVWVSPREGPAPTGAAGGSGGAVNIPDGDDVALGSTTDTAETDATEDGTLIAFTKGIVELLTGDLAIIQTPSAATVAQVSMSTTAAQIVAANSARKALVIKNMDAAIVIYIGTTSGVTSSSGGYPLAAGESIALSLSSNAWFGIAASGTPKVSAMEI